MNKPNQTDLDEIAQAIFSGKLEGVVETLEGEHIYWRLEVKEVSK